MHIIKPMNKSIIFLILFLLFSLTSSFAIQEAKKISLEDALNLALETNPQMKMAKLDVEASKNSIEIANQLKNPTLETFFNIGPTAQGNPQQIGADYVIEILKRGKRKSFAESNYLVTSEKQKFQEHILVSEVKIAYINLLLKKSNLKFISSQKELSNQIYNDALKKFNSSDISKTDLIQAKIAYNRSILYYNIARSEVITAQNRFNTALNSRDIDYDTMEDVLDDNYKNLLTLSPQDKSLTFQKVKEYTLVNRKDLIAAKQKIQSAQDNLKIVKSQLVPDLELTGGYGYQTKGISDSGFFRQGAYAGASLVNIPLIYRYKPEIKNAQIEIEKASLSYEDLETDIIRNITDAWEKFTIAKNNLNFYDTELLVNSKELLEESFKTLNKGGMDLTSFLVSKKLYIEMELGYKQALCEYYISFAELLREMNMDYSNLDEFI